MIQEIQFSGVTAQPSDYQSPDGALTTAINLIPEDGQLNPVLPPKQIAQLPSDYTIVFIHKTATYCHYIVKHSVAAFPISKDELYWLDESDIKVPSEGETIPIKALFTSDENYKFNDITAVGNTIILSLSNGLRYILWQDEIKNYSNLGQHIPELPISFSLSGVVRESGDDYYTVEGVPGMTLHPGAGDTMIIDNEEIKDKITDSVLSKVNAFIEKQSIEESKFIFPFFVRYALRLYDGTLTMYSSPVLMITTSYCCPQSFIVGFGNDYIKYKIAALVFDLEKEVMDVSKLTELKKWSDIVTSVDVFISSPVYTYKQSDKVQGVSNLSYEQKGFSISHYAREEQYDTRSYLKYLVNEKIQAEITTIENCEFILPTYGDSEVAKSIGDVTNFYLLSSIKLDNLRTGRDIIRIEKNYLNSLTSRERISYENDSQDYINAKFLHVYNNRLHLGNVTKTLTLPSRPSAYVDYTNTDIEGNHTPGTRSEYKVYMIIKKNGSSICVADTDDSGEYMGHELSFPFFYFYYPDPNAEFVIIKSTSIDDVRDEIVSYYKLPLTSHDFLRGVYFFQGWNVDWEIYKTTITPPSVATLEERTIPLPNKLYVSEVGNPFFFPVTSINTIGSGEIIGISSASKALSQGQFGQFPLYAFCSDGVWALSVNSTGGYNTVQPITRDVCISKDSITSTDSEVLFATDRGIMLLSGSSASCISDAINTKHQFNVLGLPGMEKLHDEILGHDKDGCLPMAPFLDFIKGCRMLYDYVHQRILLFNSQKTYAYLFSLKSKQWGIMKSNIASALNSYPDALAMTNDSKLVTFSEFGADSEKCMLVTRPFKLGNPDMLKTIHSLFIRGQFSNKDACVVLYGTRDMEHWHLVGSSWNHKLRYLRGSGYKAFILASVATLTEAKTLTGVTVEFTPRQTNKLL